jgi:hypothetical protein
MSKLNLEIYVCSETSKNVLNSIILDKNINFKKLKIENLKIQIENLRNEYLKIKKKLTAKSLNYKYFIFWEIIKNKYSENIITLKKRKQKNDKKVNIIFSELNKALGYNPSLLTILVFEKEIKSIIRYDNFFKELQKFGDLENINSQKKISIINKINSGKVQLITPLCPDYEHVKVAMGLYKYTFNKLNDGVGLIGKRLVKIIEKIHEIFRKYDIKFEHILYYGDFESYSKDILLRTRETEKSFIKKLENSVKKMEKVCPSQTSVKLLVKNLSTKKSFSTKCKKNEIKLIKKLKKNISLKRNISEISASRAALYSSWFPDSNNSGYEKIVIKQGAEYISMGELFIENFKRPIVLGLDHPKMGLFYSIFNDLTAVYGRPKYV